MVKLVDLLELISLIGMGLALLKAVYNVAWKQEKEAEQKLLWGIVTFGLGLTIALEVANDKPGLIAASYEVLTTLAETVTSVLALP